MPIHIREQSDLSGYLKLDQTTPQTTIGTFTFPILVVGTGSLTSSTGTVNLGNNNLTTTGTGTIGTVDFGSSTGVSATATNGVLTLQSIAQSYKYLTFNGTTSTVTVPNDSSHNAIFGSTSFSIEWLGVIDGLGETAGRIIDKSNVSTTSIGYALYVQSNHNIETNIGVSGSVKHTITANNTIVYGNLCHIVVSWTSGSAPKIYIDGAEASYSGTPDTVTTPLDDTALDISIGNRTGATDRTFNGSMRHLRIYRNHALTPTEITTLYGGGTVAGATAEYLFTEGSGASLGDTSGNGNNGTIANATWGSTGNNENLLFDFETTPNVVGISSSTGVTDINWGSLNYITTGTLGAGAITGTSIIKSGGTSAQFLKADGSVDSSTYLTSTALTSTYVGYGSAGNVLTGGSNFTFNGTRLSPNYITLAAGTTTAGTAPLKFTSGVSLTNPELGAVEFTDPNLFLTVQDSGILSAELFTSFAANQWTITSGWTLPSGTSLTHSGSGTTTATYTGFTPVVGVTYKLRINYNSFASGSIVTSFAGTTNPARTAGQTGSITYIITATTTDQLVFTPSGTTAANINVISIFAYTKLAKGFVLDDGTRLVSGNMPKVSTDGRLISDTSFTWSGTGYTITPSATQGTALTIAGATTPYANPSGPIIGIYSKRSTSGSTTSVFNVNTLQTEAYNTTAITGGSAFSFFRAFSIYGDAQSSGAHSGVFTPLAVDRTVGIFANSTQMARTITGSGLLMEAQGIWVTPQVQQITYNKVGGTITLQPTGINSDMTITAPIITNGTMNLTATGLSSAISYAGGYNGTVVGYGVYVNVKNDFGTGTTWAFYNAGTYGNNAFGINNSAFGMTATTVPTAKVHIGAGTATAGTAPLKFTSGTSLTTAEVGAVEYDGTHLFATPTGTLRERIPTGWNAGGTATAGTTTTVTDARAKTTSTIFIQPTSAGFAGLANYISTKNNGSFVITTTIALGTETFDYCIIN